MSGSKFGFISGPNKKSGGHDHRSNTGKSRTPAQKSGSARSGESRRKK